MAIQFLISTEEAYFSVDISDPGTVYSVEFESNCLLSVNLSIVKDEIMMITTVMMTAVIIILMYYLSWTISSHQPPNYSPHYPPRPVILNIIINP